MTKILQAATNSNDEQHFIKHLLEIEHETVVFIKGKPFVITPANIDDLDRIHRGQILD